jgi:hypothetical protein
MTQLIMKSLLKNKSSYTIKRLIKLKQFLFKVPQEINIVTKDHNYDKKNISN